MRLNAKGNNKNNVICMLEDIFCVLTDVKRICDYEPCLNNGTCSESKNRLICSCPDGYSGELCEGK